MIYSLLRGMREARAAKLYEQEVEVFCALVRSDSWLERMKLDIILRNLRAKRRRLER